MATYAVLGSTGNCGSALIDVLRQSSATKIHAYCRNKKKLLTRFPKLEVNGQAEIFEGSITDIDLLSSCVRGTRAVFLVVSTNDNIPGCRLSQDTAVAVIKALEKIRADGGSIPKLALLSSCTIDDYLSRHTPWILRQILLMSASNVYNDLIETEKILRANESWLTTIYIKPGALSLDVQRGHALSFTEESSPISYMDLAAGMIEAVDDGEGRYDQKNVSVVNTNGPAKFPSGTPMCILLGLVRYFFPALHTYLPTNAGP